ncbi:hypothetical protein BD777DRAFT_132239 [Yarrowia lipolytica]|nr:hypothetical protein BD777DRAFT_132239 [Yarrowia lipolytica]
MVTSWALQCLNRRVARAETTVAWIGRCRNRPQTACFRLNRRSASPDHPLPCLHCTHRVRKAQKQLVPYRYAADAVLLYLTEGAFSTLF